MRDPLARSRSKRRPWPERWPARIVTFILLLAVWLAPAGPASGADIKAYRAARIVVSPGNAVEPGLLLVKDGKVEDVLRGDAAVPEGAEVVDLGAVVIFPGFVNPLTAHFGSGGSRESVVSLGGGGGAPNDQRGLVAASRLPFDDASLRRIARSGYTSYGWLPSTTGLFAGQASALRPRLSVDKEPKALVLQDSAYLFGSYELGKRWKDSLRGAFEKTLERMQKEEEEEKKKAEDARKAQEAQKGTPAPPAQPGAPPASPPQPPKPPPPPDPLADVFPGKRRLVLRVQSAASIDHLFSVLDGLSRKLKIVLALPPPAPETAQRLLARRDLIQGVILEPTVADGRETSVLSSAPRLFIEAGLEVALVPPGDSYAGHEAMLLRLAELVRGGLQGSQALSSVTTVPARLLGLEGKVGALTKGAAASFVAYDGDPLGGAVRPLGVWVEGHEVFRDDIKTLRVTGEALR